MPVTAAQLTAAQQRNLRRLIEVLEVCSGRDGCHPRREVIAAKMEVSIPTVSRAVALARRLRLLTVEPRLGGGQGANEYRVHWERIRACSSHQVDGLLLSRPDRFALLRHCDFNLAGPRAAHQNERAAHQNERAAHQNERAAHQNDPAPPGVTSELATASMRFLEATSSIDPSIDPITKSMEPPAGGDGFLDDGQNDGWTWPPIAPDELKSPSAIAKRFLMAAAAGVVDRRSECDRLAFFALARYCHRRGADAGAFFNWCLRNVDEQGQHWRAKPAAEDEDWAHRVLRRSDRPRGPAISHGADQVDNERREQLERLRVFAAEGTSAASGTPAGVQEVSPAGIGRLP